MTNVSFVQEHGLRSSGKIFWVVVNRHQGTQNHMANHTAYKLLENVDVACALDQARQREVARHNHDASRYSKMLKHHIDVAVFLSAQGLAFRGHDETKCSSNRGNFLELLELLGNYSNDLRSFLDHDHVTYTSHEPQNELIECIYNEVRQEIQKRVENSKFIAVMMDDTSDSSNVEQSAVSVRLVHDGVVEEHLLGLIDASGDTSADRLTAILLETLDSYNVKPETSDAKVVGQSYDGAPSMSGELNGVQKQIQDHFPSAYYNHCVAHRRSLCASQTSMSIPKIANFLGTADKLVSFFRSSPKRSRNLGQNLPRPGDTRWLSRDTAVTAIDTHYEAIGNFLFAIANDTNEKPETRATARGLGIHIQQIEFLYFLKLYRKLFDYCSPIITVMQRPTIDPIQLRSMLNDFQRTLSRFDYHQVWEDSVLEDPEFPAVRARGGWRGLGQEIDGSQESWKMSLETVAKTVTAKFSEQLAWRFANLEKFKWMELVYPTKFESRKKATAAQQRALIGDVKKLYPFAVQNVSATEHNLDVLYNNEEIKILLTKLFPKEML